MTAVRIEALISEPIRLFGEEAVRRVEFRNCSDEVRELVLTVVEYTLMAIDSAENSGCEASGQPSGG